MNLTRMTVNLIVLAILTTTRARSIVEHRTGVTIREEPKRDDDSLKRSSNEKDYEREESEAYDETLMKKYARSEAEKLLRISTRMSGKRRRSLHGIEDRAGPSFSTRRLEKMLEKAILKIITGDLSTADMLLLKSLNYSLEEVLSVRERGLRKKNPPVPSLAVTKISHEPKMNNDLIDGDGSRDDWERANRLENYDEKRSTMRMKSGETMSSGSSSEKKSVDRDFDFDAYNRQAVYDYETAANGITSPSRDSDSIEASLDYENRGNDRTVDVDDDVRENFHRAHRPHVVFKIRYDDSEFDSSSNERAKQSSGERNDRFATRNHRGDRSDDHRSKNATARSVSSTRDRSTSFDANATPASSVNKTFQASTADMLASLPVARRLGNFVAPYEDPSTARGLDRRVESDEGTTIAEGEDPFDSSETSTTDRASGSSTPRTERLKKMNGDEDESMKNGTSDEPRRKSIYEGLEWVEDDVYRVIPEAVDSLNYYDSGINEMENDTIEDSELNGTLSSVLEGRVDDDNDDGIANDTIGYQNENPRDETRSQTESAYSSMRNSPDVDLSTYQQLALAHRRDGNNTSPFDSQGQKAIEDIKLKVLAMTGRFNLSSGGNQVQRERLTMFSPICQLPKNTDAEAWSDPFSMNMNFQLNLTTGNHVVAAKVRIYVLPQNNVTASTVGANDNEDEEEKIRISIYFYTKSLKKHRSKKRLIDSVVISLTPQGSHWALDVRQALRFWRQNLRNSHNLSNNHGLVIQVEDQDGRSLKPSQFIQQDSCHTSELNGDEKAYQRVPALFVQACSRYVRVVNGEPVTYVNCRKTSRKVRH